MNPHPDEEKSVNKSISRSGSEGLSLMQALNFAWQMGYTMAVPLILLALAGRLLDKQYQTSPLFLLTGIILSIIISSILVAQKATSIIRKMDIEGKKERSGKSNNGKKDEKDITTR